MDRTAEDVGVVEGGGLDNGEALVVGGGGDEGERSLSLLVLRGKFGRI